MRKFLDDDQLATVRRLWHAGERRDAIAQAAGITVDTLLARMRDQLADLPRRPRRSGSGHRGVDPTLEEIVARAAAIRAGWPDTRFVPEDRDETIHTRSA